MCCPQVAARDSDGWDELLLIFVASDFCTVCFWNTGNTQLMFFETHLVAHSFLSTVNGLSSWLPQKLQVDPYLPTYVRYERGVQ